MSKDTEPSVRELAEQFTSRGISEETAIELAEIAIYYKETAVRPSDALTQVTIDQIADSVSYVLGEKLSGHQSSLLREIVLSFCVSLSANYAFTLIQPYLIEVASFFAGAEDHSDKLKKEMEIRGREADASVARFPEGIAQSFDRNSPSIHQLRESYKTELESVLRNSDVLPDGEASIFTTMIFPIIEQNLILRPFRDSLGKTAQ